MWLRKTCRQTGLSKLTTDSSKGCWGCPALPFSCSPTPILARHSSPRRYNRLPRLHPLPSEAHLSEACAASTSPKPQNCQDPTDPATVGPALDLQPGRPQPHKHQPHRPPSSSLSGFPPPCGPLPGTPRAPGPRPQSPRHDDTASLTVCGLQVHQDASRAPRPRRAQTSSAHSVGTSP